MNDGPSANHRISISTVAKETYFCKKDVVNCTTMEINVTSSLPPQWYPQRRCLQWMLKRRSPSWYLYDDQGTKGRLPSDLI